MLQHIDESEPRVVGRQAVPRIAGIEEPLLHVAVVSACVCRPRSLNGQAVQLRGRSLKLQAGIWPHLVSGAAVSIAEDGVMADGEHALPLSVLLSRLVTIVLVLRALHVPGDGEAGVSGRLGWDATAQSDGARLFHGHV